MRLNGKIGCALRHKVRANTNYTKGFGGPDGNRRHPYAQLQQSSKGGVDYVFITCAKKYKEILTDLVESNAESILSFQNYFEVIKLKDNHTVDIESVYGTHVKYNIPKTCIMSVNRLVELINSMPGITRTTVDTEEYRIRLKIDFYYQDMLVTLYGDNENGVVKISSADRTIERRIFYLFKNELELVSNIDMLLKRNDYNEELKDCFFVKEIIDTSFNIHDITYSAYHSHFNTHIRMSVHLKPGLASEYFGLSVYRLCTKGLCAKYCDMEGKIPVHITLHGLHSMGREAKPSLMYAPRGHTRQVFCKLLFHMMRKYELQPSDNIALEAGGDVNGDNSKLIALYRKLGFDIIAQMLPQKDEDEDGDVTKFTENDPCEYGEEGLLLDNNGDMLTILMVAPIGHVLDRCETL